MKKLALILCLLAAPAHAQLLLLGVGGATSGPSFVGGVIDQESTITMCAGLVACSAALATSGAVAVDLCGATGCAAATGCPNIKVAANGQLDTTVGLYCGNGTTGGTDTVTQYCTNVKTCVAGGTARVSGLWEQKAESVHFTAASYAVAPDFLLSGVGGYPTMQCVSSRSTLLGATVTAISPSYSVGITVERTANFTTLQSYTSDSDAALTWWGQNAANTALTYQDNPGSAVTASDGTGATDLTGTNTHNLFLTWTTTNVLNEYVDGTNALVNSSVGNPGTTGTTFNVCGAFTDSTAFVRRVWWDNTAPSSTIGDNVTNKTKVGF